MKKLKLVAKSSEENGQDQITAQLRYIKEFSLFKYDAEEKREQNMIQQSSQMQTAFSFISAAVFMAIPICVEHRGELSLKFFFISVSFIVAFLVASLVLASLAQWRWKTKTFPDIDEMKSFVINNEEWQKLCIEYHQINQWIEILSTVQKEKARLNDRRVKLILASMICFYTSIATILVCFTIAIVKMI